MERLSLNDNDLSYLKENYPDLKYNKESHTISGTLRFHLSYNDVPLSGVFNIEIPLYRERGSLLPRVRETRGRVAAIAKRKNVDLADVHLKSEVGHLCLIFPLKEREFYPNGFDLRVFLTQIEYYFYWIKYYDRYDQKPWEDEPHGEEEALRKAAKENPKYRKALKEFWENNANHKYSRAEFRRKLKKQNII